MSLTHFSVLVADDEIINLRFLKECLTHAGCRVTIAQDGAQAVERVLHDAPHLIILDINMPVLDGWQAAAAIRASKRNAAGAPILAYTSLAIGEDELRRRGFDGRIEKPCDPAHLVDIVEQWHPGGELAGVERLAQVFAPADLDDLVARLRDQLAAALVGVPDASVAHRIAGAAGTLGFAKVSESWLALSNDDGNDGVRDQARADARRAVAAIDRRWSADGRTYR